MDWIPHREATAGLLRKMEAKNEETHSISSATIWEALLNKEVFSTSDAIRKAICQATEVCDSYQLIEIAFRTLEASFIEKVYSTKSSSYQELAIRHLYTTRTYVICTMLLCDAFQGCVSLGSGGREMLFEERYKDIDATFSTIVKSGPLTKNLSTPCSLTNTHGLVATFH